MSLNIPKTSRTIALAVVGGLLVGLWLVRPAQAASGFTVSPTLLRMSVSTKTPHEDSFVSVKNDFTVPVKLSAGIFKADDSRTSIVPTNSPDLLLRQVITVSPDSLNLAPGDSINIRLHTNDIATLSPGGHYGALVIKQESLPGQRISVVSAVSVSLFIVKEDGAIRSISLSRPHVPRIAFQLPKELELMFKNDGNVDVVPRAAVSITRGNGLKVYAKGVVNQESIPLFPKKEVTLQTKLASLSRISRPGKYQLTARYRAEGSAEEQVSSVSFWYIPWWLPVGVVVLLIVLWSVYKGRRLFRRRKTLT